MAIKNLYALKRSIGRSVVISFLVVAILTLFATYFNNKRYETKKAELALQQIDNASQAFQANLSEQLNLIASSNIFLDYLRSGPKSRDELKQFFVHQLSRLKSEAIVGMTILDGHDQLFTNGMATSDLVTLKLCYLNRELNSSLGECRYRWILFFDKNLLIKELRKINNSILSCPICSSISFFKSSKFSSFPLEPGASITAGLRVNETEQDKFLFYTEFFIFFALVAFAIWNNFWIQKMVRRYIDKPLRELTIHLKTEEVIKKQPEIEEIRFLSNQIESWKSEVKQAQKQKQAAELGKLAAQVAHDVDSPINALKEVAKDLLNMPEQHRIIIRHAVGRIQAISRKLLDKYKGRVTRTRSTSNLVSVAIDNIVLEKQAEYSSKKVTFKTQINPTDYFLFAEFIPVEFQEILSNLLNNAVESILDVGEVIVKLSSEDEWVVVSIQDNGKGIPQEVLENLLLEGISYEKKTGSGLGLSHAKTQVQSWNGSIQIQSILGRGTTVNIKLPKTEIPKWVPTKICVSNPSTIIILDDDLAFHAVLKKLITNCVGSADDVYLQTFIEPEELIVWLKKNPVEKNHLFLIDHEFFGSKLNGLDLIKLLGIEKQSILITGRFEEEEIQNNCQRLGVKLLPKTVVPYLPFVLVKNHPDLVFLDDNEAITLAWRMKGQSAGKTIEVFNQSDDLLRCLGTLPKTTPIYIDSDLNEQRRGEEIAEVIFQKGYKNIFLATGFESEKFANLPWIKAVVGKEPPTLH